MKKIIYALLAMISASTGVNAEILYRVSGNGAQGDSYIFGTHHIAPTSMLDSVPGLRQALGEVATVCGELDMSQLQSPEAQGDMMRYGMAPQDSLLTMVLTPEQTDSVNSVFAKYTNGQLTNAVDQMAMLKPAMVSLQISALESMVAFPGFDPSQQLDTTIQNIAREEGKTVLALETVEQQMELVLGGSISLQATELMETVADDMSGKALETAQKMADAYIGQDVDEIGVIMINETEDEEARNRIVYLRNANWAGQLPAIFAENPTFVAVGAAHLPGEKGLLQLLREQGYTVEPVK